MISAMTPYYIVKVLLDIAMMRFQRNVGGGFSVQLPKQVKFIYSFDLPIKLFKQRCSEMKSSMTIMAQSLIGQGLYEYA